MERSEVSAHEVRVWAVLCACKVWLTNDEIAQAAQVAPRTARHHTKRLKDLGLVDVADVFPGHRYRASEFAGKRNAAYVQRLAQAAEVLGLGS